MHNNDHCDRCGKQVNPRDDVRQLEALVLEQDAIITFLPRHILCSPSRAQYITVLPIDLVDVRKQYNKFVISTKLRFKMEKLWTDAYLMLQSNYDIVKGAVN